MKKYFKRFLTSLGALIGRLFNVGIPLKIVLLLVVLVGPLRRADLFEDDEKGRRQGGL